MSTRSLIGILNKDGTVSHAFCHWDGYPENNGKILSKYYTNIEQIKELISYRNISSLGTTPVPTLKIEEDDYQKRVKNEDGFYVRTSFSNDPQDKELGPYISKNIKQYMNEDGFQEYSYLLVNGKWYVQNLTNNPDVFYLLSDVLAKSPKPEELNIHKLVSIKK